MSSSIFIASESNNSKGRIKALMNSKRFRYFIIIISIIIIAIIAILFVTNLLSRISLSDIKDGTITAYVVDFNITTGEMTFDEVEKLGPGDVERIYELGLTQDDFPNSEFIYNESEITKTLKVSENAEYSIIKVSSLFPSDKKGFIEVFNDYTKSRFDLICYITIKNGKIIKIEQQYMV